MTSDLDRRLIWTQPDWLSQIGAWALAELERLGIRPSGPIEQPHARPWSTALRVPTDSGLLYIKATMPALSHEPALTAALARWRPDCTPEVLATAPERGWMIMRDSGATLRSLVQSPDDLWRWEQILPVYAGLQIELAGRTNELLALGALDRRLAGLAARYEQVLSDTAALLIDQPDGMTGDEHRRLLALAPQVAEQCAWLAAAGVPETLHHDDLHDGNIFMRDGQARIADWAESCVTHPFFTLVVLLRSIAYRQKLDEHGPEIARLRDSYLEPWGSFAPRPQLLEVAALARRLGMICRALTWHLVLGALEEPFRAQDAEAVPGWLQEFLAAQ